MKTITKTTTTSLSFEDIESLIDNHLADEINLLFVCDRKLAESICEYVLNEYNLIDEDMELIDDIKEYYVTFDFNDGGVDFFCETANGISGEYKMHDIPEYTDYYICVNMDMNVAFNKLLGDEGSWNFVRVELGEDDVKNEIDNECFEYIDDKCDEEECNDCKECGKEIDLENVIDIYTEMIQGTNGCAKKISEVLWQFADIFIGCIDECDNEEEDFEKNECCECECEKYCDGNCEDCEIPAGACVDIHIVEELVREFEESDCQCEACLRNMIYRVLMIGKDIRWHDHKEYIRYVVDKVLED